MSETKKHRVPLRIRLACWLLRNQAVQTYYVRFIVAGVTSLREMKRLVSENNHLQNRAPHVRVKLLSALQKVESIFVAADFQPNKDSAEHFGLLQAELLRAKEDAAIAVQERDALKVRLEEQVRTLGVRVNELSGQNGRMRRRLDRAQLQQLPREAREVVEALRRAKDALDRAALDLNATLPQDDSKCETLPDGRCVSKGPCMHSPRPWHGYLTPALIDAIRALEPYAVQVEAPVQPVQPVEAAHA